ncbi:MAG: N-formylglutamate amidohydrolase [Paracoccaceae bacterium]
MKTTARLLQPDDPKPFAIENEDGVSAILFISDHAGVAIPKRLGTLGLGRDELSRHIAYDVGIYGVTSELARNLGATYVFQPYSRLVIDCNRKPGMPQSVMAQTDGTKVPGNEGLSTEDIRAREAEILRPYHDNIERVLRDRAASLQPTAIIAMHSCTERLRSDGRPRPWQISVIAHEDWRIGDALVEVLNAETGLCVGINEPYTVDMEMDYTIPHHAEGGKVPYVEIEIRQDLIADPEGQHEWARRLTSVFPKAVALSGVVSG